MTKKYIVRLTHDERKKVKDLVRKGKVAAYKRTHAEIFLQADIGKEGGGKTDKQISEGLGITVRTIEKTRKRLIEKGIEGAINRSKPIRTKPKLLDGEKEAHLIAIACGDAPEGRSRWTLRLLANKMVELNLVESISHETIRQTLKKTNSNLGKKKSGAFLQKTMLSLCVLWKIL